jgi:prevent-host-death family protein
LPAKKNENPLFVGIPLPLLNWFIRKIVNYEKMRCLMEKVNAFEAKTRFSELLRETEKGKSFIICRRGKEVGRLLPPAPDLEEGKISSISEKFQKIRKRYPARSISGN